MLPSHADLNQYNYWQMRRFLIYFVIPRTLPVAIHITAFQAVSMNFKKNQEGLKLLDYREMKGILTLCQRAQKTEFIQIKQKEVWLAAKQVFP
jgi:hypothetical protein